MQIHELPSGTPTDSDLLPFDTGTVNYKTPFSGFDVGENTATFTSADEADPAQFKTVDPIETGPIKTILNRLSMAVSNVRYIWKYFTELIGDTAMGTTATTITGAIKEVRDSFTSAKEVTSANYTFNGKTFYFNRQGNVVTMLAGTDLSLAAQGWQDMFTVATQFRPRDANYFQYQNSSGDMQMFMCIDSTGLARLWCSQAITSVHNAAFNGSWITLQSR